MAEGGGWVDGGWCRRIVGRLVVDLVQESLLGSESLMVRYLDLNG